MAMDDADARAILREHGEEVPARGRLSPDLKARAEALRADGDDYADGTSPDDFLAADEPADEPEPAPAPVAERKPRRVKASRPSLRDRIKNGPAPKAKPKRKQPRVSIAQLVESGWGLLARIAGPIAPATAACLELEADVAGVVLEDVIRDTVVDRALQPIARAQERSEKVASLAAPPLIVFGLELSQGMPPAQRAARQAILIPLLRESLALQVRVIGKQAKAIEAHAEERREVYAEADRRMQLILGPLMAQEQPEEQAEDTSMAEAQEMAGV